MIYVGLDDTDTLDDPGTNQLARHLVRELAGSYSGRIIIRHQLLEDPRAMHEKERLRIDNVCTNYEYVGWLGSSLGEPSFDHAKLISTIRDIIIPWCPAGSDPGLCVTETVPLAVMAWGLRCKRELVNQSEARQIAATHCIHLEGLGGTEDGVIGALAAIGLMATKNDGRVVYFGSSGEDWYDVTGCLPVDEILARGVQEVCTMDGTSLKNGTVDVGKRLRPNYRQGKVVLFVTQTDAPHWEAVRIT